MSKIFYVFLVSLLSTFLLSQDQENIESAINQDYELSQISHCINGEEESCNELLKRGYPTSKDCNPAIVCALVGNILSLANKDREAIAYLKKACNAREGYSCFSLALSYENIRDFENAKNVYYLSCEREDILSCYNLGIAYVRGENVRQDYKYAHRLFQKSCRNMYPKACFNIGVLYAKGYGLNEDLSIAKVYFDISCDMGLSIACDVLDELDRENIKIATLKKSRGRYIKEFP